MAKFVFARVDEPTEPSWNCQMEKWQNPENYQAPFEMPNVWMNLWNWMSGQAGREAGWPSGVPLTPGRIQLRDELVALLAPHNEDMFKRLNAIYMLALLGAEGAEPLCIELAKHEES